MNYVLSVVCFVCIYLFHQILFNGNDGLFVIVEFVVSIFFVFSDDKILCSFPEKSLNNVMSGLTIVYPFSEIKLKLNNIYNGK